LVKADYDLAGAGRAAAKELCAKYQTPEKSIWFEGHWGFQYYMEQLGAKPLDFAYHRLAEKEIVVLPTPGNAVLGLPAEMFRQIEMRETESGTGCSTMGPSAGAGFYGAVFGPLPFRLGRGEPARFSVCEITRTDDQGALQQMGQTEPKEQTLNRFQRALLSHPNDAQTQFQLAQLLSRQGSTTEAIAHYREGLRLKPDAPEGLNNLAWILATDPDESKRNGAEAVRLAAQACDRTGWKKPVMLGTLAAAYAEAGRFGEAVAAAQKAIETAEAAGQSDLAAINRRLIEIYRANRAYHQDLPQR
jgi:Flp pilus assembly protein TadD